MGSQKKLVFAAIEPLTMRPWGNSVSHKTTTTEFFMMSICRTTSSSHLKTKIANEAKKNSGAPTEPNRSRFLRIRTNPGFPESWPKPFFLHHQPSWQKQIFLLLEKNLYSIDFHWVKEKNLIGTIFALKWRFLKKLHKLLHIMATYERKFATKSFQNLPNLVTL